MNMVALSFNASPGNSAAGDGQNNASPPALWDRHEIHRVCLAFEGIRRQKRDAALCHGHPRGILKSRKTQMRVEETFRAPANRPPLAPAFVTSIATSINMTPFDPEPTDSCFADHHAA